MARHRCGDGLFCLDRAIVIILYQEIRLRYLWNMAEMLVSNFCRFVCAALIACTFCLPVHAADDLVFAVANGYPPYQFKSEAGTPAGLDVEVVKLVCARLGITTSIVQGPWDDMVTALRIGRVDCVAGMEVTEKRKNIFDFTSPYYSRRSAMFTLEDNRDIRRLEDLRGLIVAGDRHSYTEKRLSQLDLKQRIRIRQTRSKDQSVRLLKSGDVVAFIAPVAVARYLARRHDVALHMIENSDPGIPVALAVNSGETRLRDLLDAAILELFHDGSMDALLVRWGSK